MGCNSSKSTSKAVHKKKILPIMSFLPSSNANQYQKKQVPATKGLASSFGFKKTTQTNKIRPISAPIQFVEKPNNFESKMLPKPMSTPVEKCSRSIPKSNTPSPNRFGFCKPATKLVQPTTQVTKKVEVERRSQSEPQKREIPKLLSSGTKIAVSRVTSSHLPRPQIPIRYQVSKSPDKNAKTATNMRLKNEAIKQMQQGVTIRKLTDSVEFTEVIAFNRPSRLTINSNAKGSLIRERANKYLRQVSSSSSKHLTSSDDDSDVSSYEEKHDKEEFVKEKTEQFDKKDTTCSDEEYGPGEALAVEEFTEMKDKINVIDNKFANVDMSISLRDVLLNIEDTTFATLAAMSSTIRIEDETSPDDECLSPTESESAEFPHSKTESTNNDKRDSMSPILRCNISKSGSFSSDTRDFFDDEIADQPALMFSGPPSESCNAEDIDDAIFRLGNHSSCNKKSRSLRRSLSADGSLSESLNSDDLMLDVDYDQTDDKLIDPDNDDLLKTLESTKQNSFNEWKSLTSSRNSSSSLKDDVVPVKDETDSKGSNGDVLMSFDRFREVTDDIASIKNMLFELNRALIEDKQDITYPEDQEVHCCYENQILDLKQQIAYMAQQMEQKDRTIQMLNEQIAQRPRPSITTTETRNAATQTDRCRSTTAPTLCTFDREGQSNGRPVIRCSDMTERSKSVSGNRIRIGMLKHKFLMDAGRTLPNV
ncbi:putative leucine-rich repeat-containing protein DDB_G0290503 isoform X1 [Myzus persicae]|uniref:putative leucine-rich repeat-containing protein DDB_G0290503 isoform X1 n=2 Tax=Myzus persicae TaxID=13164 RepID=UPI000B934DA4|nr:putative leucine-rich repeat-containing protein DDB_G0290503 isoform X1 [Myzus persicae]XP_022161229.1 putative leucine-rich repeat-containing protein DDB_G0290503 isoform X1 [Myzus persicae]